MSERAGRVYGGNAGLAFELRACAEKALRTGRERGSIRSDLIFWLLFYQEKSNSPPAAIERADFVLKA